MQKVTGKALHTGDIRLPGMVYAKVLRPPAHGAKLKRIDTSTLGSDSRMIVVEEPGLTAVLHPYPDMAAVTAYEQCNTRGMSLLFLDYNMSMSCLIPFMK